VNGKIAKVDMTWRRNKFLDTCGEDHESSSLEECSIEMVLQKKMNGFQLGLKRVMTEVELVDL
jgi:hypothetical protein